MIKKTPFPPGLNVSLVFVNRHLPPTVNNLHKAVLVLAGLVQGLVSLLVVTDSFLEILQYFVLGQV